MRCFTFRAAVAVAVLSCVVSARLSAQSVLVEAKTTAGNEVATIRTDSMRLLVPLHLLVGGLLFPDGTFQTTAAAPWTIEGKPEEGYSTGPTVATPSNTPWSIVARDAAGGFRTERLAVADTLRLSGSFVAFGETPGDPTQMLWYPEKGGFRAGLGDGTEWEQENVGYGSTAFGGATIANAYYTTAMGYHTAASGDYSTALGLGTTALAQASFAIGRFNVVSGDPSSWSSTDPLFVAGNGETDSDRSNALTLYKNGDLTIAGGLQGAYLWAAYASVDSVRFSDGTVQTTAPPASVEVTSAGIADGTILDADIATNAAIADTKLGTIATAGKVANSATTAAASNTANAIVARDAAGGFHAGYLVIADSLRVGGEGSFLAQGTYDHSTTTPPPSSGAGTRLMWYPEKAAFRAGHVLGAQWDVANIGNGSTALGWNTTANGPSSTALGNFTTASGYAATAVGNSTTASGDYSTAMGDNTVASGLVSTALGLYTEAQAELSLVIGRYNTIQGFTEAWSPVDPLFAAGNGTSDASRSNALTLYKNGNLTIAGTLTQSSDARLKEAIEPLEGTLDRVLQLTPIRYRFRPDTGHPDGTQIGLTAQQVQPLFPELVKEDGDGYLSLSYANLSAVLVKALQEQQAEIAALKDEVAALRAARESADARVARLENLVEQLLSANAGSAGAQSPHDASR